MMLTQDERDRLAWWMGWTLLVGDVWARSLPNGDWDIIIPSKRYWLRDPIPWEQAGILLERADELGWWVEYTTPFYPGAAHNAGLTPHNMTGWNWRPDHAAQADKGPEAICRAVLAMLEASDE